MERLSRKWTKMGKITSCYRDLLATVVLDFSLFKESYRLLLAILGVSFFSGMFINGKPSLMQIKLSQVL